MAVTRAFPGSLLTDSGGVTRTAVPSVITETAAAGGTVYEVTVSDGVYFYDGDQLKDRESTQQDNFFLNSLNIFDRESLSLDSLFLSETRSSEIEKTLLDSLFLYSSSTIEALGQAIEIAIVDYLFVDDNNFRSTEKVMEESLLIASQLIKLHELFNLQGLLLSSELFNSIDINRYDPIYLSEIFTKQIDMESTDFIFMDDTDKIYFLREMLIRDNLLQSDSVLTQLITTVTAVLVYAKLQTKDFLGIKASSNSNFLNIKAGLWTSSNL